MWEPYPTEAELSRQTGLLVIGENDANCAALGEYWTTGSPARDFVTVYMAYGIGSGIVLGGSVYRGVSGNAGEIGHTLADPNGPFCWCGRRGCLDTTASPRAVVERILDDAGLRAACDVTAGMEFGQAFQQFANAVRTGVAPVVEIFDSAAAEIAGAVVNLVNTLDLDLVTLAGPGFAPLGEEFRRVIDERLNGTGFLREVHPTTVRLGVGGAESAALGAASVVLHRELTPHHSAAPL